MRMAVPDDPEHRTDQQAHKATGNYPYSMGAALGSLDPIRHFLSILPCHFCSRDKNHSSQKFHLNDFLYAAQTQSATGINQFTKQNLPLSLRSISMGSDHLLYARADG
ncbi:MAG: hypothetical protein IJO67_01100 [Clostridia bacterium]|nr:hypothetical protein [Clostridia bacterium]